MRPTFEERWRRRFEEFGQDHDDDARIAGWSETGLQARLRNFKKSWRPSATGKQWLDAGCGAGTYTTAMVLCGQQVVGLDYSVPTLRKAGKRLDGQPVVLLAGDVTDLPFRSMSYDGVICFGVLQALSSPDRAVSELARVVRPGGMVWVDALNAYCLPNLVRSLLTKARRGEVRLRFDSPNRLKGVFRKNGFQEIQIIWVPIFPRDLHAVQRVFESRIARALFQALPWFGSAVSHAYVIAAKR